MMEVRKPWYELWFDSPYYPVLYKERDDSEAQQFIDALLERLNILPGSRIMDLACGRGRHAAYLASNGFAVTGLDISAKSIEDAKLKYHAAHLEYYIHDMRNKFRINYYDYIFNL